MLKRVGVFGLLAMGATMFLQPVTAMAADRHEDRAQIVEHRDQRADRGREKQVEQRRDFGRDRRDGFVRRDVRFVRTYQVQNDCR